MATAVRLDRSKLNTIAKAKNLFVSETCLRFCAIDLQIRFLALGLHKKNPKLSVQLAQNGSNLAQSVKLGVKHTKVNLGNRYAFQNEKDGSVNCTKHHVITDKYIGSP